MEVSGFRFSTASAGIKNSRRADMALIVSDPPARWSGTFTTNRVKAAPVLLGLERLKNGAPLSAILVNSGNANACNGERGMRDVLKLCRETAHLLGVPSEQVLMASTGVIGQPLPMEKMRAVLPVLMANLGRATLKEVATAMMTTDRYPKWEMETLKDFPGLTIAGVAKGAGMIHPNMATMLGFFFMNAGLPTSDLDGITKRAVAASFNRITVDGDQSTNDTVLVLDNGRLAETPGGREALGRAVSGKLNEIMGALAWKIVDNGEGVTKVVTLIVEKAKTPKDAGKIAESLGHSLLVKTAFYGEDPNWGRIMAAIGYSGAEMAPEEIDIFFDNVCLVSKGQCPGEAAEHKAAEVMKKRDYTVRIVLNLGEGSTRLITSDLSVEYVKINADYRS